MAERSRFAHEMATGWPVAIGRGVGFVRLLSVLLIVPMWAVRAPTTTQVAVTALAGVVSLVLVAGWSRVVGLLVAHPVLLVVDALLGLLLAATVAPTLSFVYYLMAVSLLGGLVSGPVRAQLLAITCSFGSVVVLAATPHDREESLTLESIQVVSLLALFPLCALATRTVVRIVLKRLAEAEREQCRAVHLEAVGERRRIALDLHDSLGKTLEGLTLSLSALERVLPETHRSTCLVGQMRQDMTRAVAEARMMMLELRSGHEVASEAGLVEAVGTYARRWQERTGIRVVLDLDGLPPLPRALHRTAAAIITESLANIETHSGARTARLRARAEGDCLVVDISDDGRGLPAPLDVVDLTDRGHLGLSNLTERAESLGGSCRLTSGPAGLSVAVVLPIIRASTDLRPYDQERAGA